MLSRSHGVLGVLGILVAACGAPPPASAPCFTIHALNDDEYGYDTISFPALADVGEAFSRHAFAR